MAGKRKSPYDIEGRLADVIAAVTVMAGAKESEGSLKMWANRLSRPAGGGDVEAHWLTVFSEHPEFFLTYVWANEQKAALRLRYANKTIDRRTGRVPPNLHRMTPKQRGDLTSAPLDPQATGSLIDTAISLHKETLARRADARFYFQVFGPAALALLGALAGAILPTWLKGPPPPPAPLKVIVEDARPGSAGAVGAAPRVPSPR